MSPYNKRLISDAGFTGEKDIGGSRPHFQLPFQCRTLAGSLRKISGRYMIPAALARFFSFFFFQEELGAVRKRAKDAIRFIPPRNVANYTQDDEKVNP